MAVQDVKSGPAGQRPPLPALKWDSMSHAAGNSSQLDRIEMGFQRRMVLGAGRQQPRPE